MSKLLIPPLKCFGGKITFFLGNITLDRTGVPTYNVSYWLEQALPIESVAGLCFEQRKLKAVGPPSHGFFYK